MAINYEQGRAYALSSISPDILVNPKAFAAWCNEFISELKKPIEPDVKKTVTVFTDGACSGNPGKGGWAAVLMFGDKYKEISGATIDTTNNRMELSAAIQALKALKVPCKAILQTDSAYLADPFNKGWISKWQTNGWCKSDKKPIENQDLWEELIALTGTHEVTFVKVKGHSDNEWNNRCDALAKAAIKQLEAA